MLVVVVVVVVVIVVVVVPGHHPSIERTDVLSLPPMIMTAVAVAWSWTTTATSSSIFKPSVVLRMPWNNHRASRLQLLASARAGVSGQVRCFLL